MANLPCTRSSFQPFSLLFKPILLSPRLLHVSSSRLSWPAWPSLAQFGVGCKIELTAGQVCTKNECAMCNVDICHFYICLLFAFVVSTLVIFLSLTHVDKPLIIVNTVIQPKQAWIKTYTTQIIEHKKRRMLLCFPFVDRANEKKSARKKSKKTKCLSNKKLNPTPRR